mgnify:CR=1 FL=1
MFAPLSEHVENKLDEAFCEEFRCYGTYDKPNEWEEYKEVQASGRFNIGNANYNRSLYQFFLV